MQLERVAEPSPVEAGSPESQLQQRRNHAVGPKQQVRMAVGCRAFVVARLGSAPGREAIFQIAYGMD
jgi:hypothetical protein